MTDIEMRLLAHDIALGRLGILLKILMENSGGARTWAEVISDPKPGAFAPAGPGVVLHPDLAARVEITEEAHRLAVRLLRDAVPTSAPLE